MRRIDIEAEYSYLLDYAREQVLKLLTNNSQAYSEAAQQPEYSLQREVVVRSVLDKHLSPNREGFEGSGLPISYAQLLVKLIDIKQIADQCVTVQQQLGVTYPFLKKAAESAVYAYFEETLVVIATDYAVHVELQSLTIEEYQILVEAVASSPFPLRVA